MDYGKISKEVLDLDPKIRYAGVCDDTGETKFGGQREGVENLFSSEETKRSNLQALARWNLDADSDRKTYSKYFKRTYSEWKLIF